MVPTALVPLAEIPLTETDKPTGGVAGRTRRRRHEQREPRNAHERKLCAIFCELLGRARVGVDDDFFDLAGIR